MSSPSVLLPALLFGRCLTGQYPDLSMPSLHPCMAIIDAWTLVCLWTGFHGLKGVDTSRHHQMVTNSHGMFWSFKIMTSYYTVGECSEYDDVNVFVDYDLNFHITYLTFLRSPSSPVYGVITQYLTTHTIRKGFVLLWKCLFWVWCDFSISFSGRDMSRNVWNRLLWNPWHSGGRQMQWHHGANCSRAEWSGCRNARSGLVSVLNRLKRLVDKGAPAQAKSVDICSANTQLPHVLIDLSRCFLQVSTLYYLSGMSIVTRFITMNMRNKFEMNYAASSSSWSKKSINQI